MATKTKPDLSDQWQQVATALGISLPQAHQLVEKIQTAQNALGQGGVGGATPQSAIQTILSQAGATPTQGQLRSGAERYGDYTSGEWAALTPEQKAQAIQSYVQDPSTQQFSPGTAKEVAGEVKSPTKDTKLPSPSDAAKNVPESPFEQLAQSLASEYLGQVQQLMPLTSGSGIFGPSGATNQTVNAAAAAIPGGGAWLQQQAAAEQQAAQPLQAVMGQVGEAQAQGAIPYAGAIANTGTANTQYLEAAPWQQILSELASETAYKAASTTGASAFGATPQNTPAFLAQIFSNLGLAGSSNGGLSTPGLSTPKKAATGGSGSSSSALSSDSESG